MLSSGPMWGLMIGQIAHDWALFMINADLPKYMKSVMKFSIAEVSVEKKPNGCYMLKLVEKVTLK